MESGEAVANARVALSVAMAIARALLHGICEEDEVRQREKERGGFRESDAKHQSISLNHWHHSFFRALQTDGAPSLLVAQTSNANTLLQHSNHRFFSLFFIVVYGQNPLL